MAVQVAWRVGPGAWRGGGCTALDCLGAQWRAGWVAWPVSVRGGESVGVSGGQQYARVWSVRGCVRWAGVACACLVTRVFFEWCADDTCVLGDEAVLGDVCGAAAGDGPAG